MFFRRLSSSRCPVLHGTSPSRCVFLLFLSFLLLPPNCCCRFCPVLPHSASASLPPASLHLASLRVSCVRCLSSCASSLLRFRPSSLTLFLHASTCLCARLLCCFLVFYLPHSRAFPSPRPVHPLRASASPPRLSGPCLLLPSRACVLAPCLLFMSLCCVCSCCAVILLRHVLFSALLFRFVLDVAVAFLASFLPMSELLSRLSSFPSVPCSSGRPLHLLLSAISSGCPVPMRTRALYGLGS